MRHLGSDLRFGLRMLARHPTLSTVSILTFGLGLGLATVRRLGPERSGRVPAAAITALASEEDHQRAMQSGFQLHVAKPIDAARLAAVVSLLADWKW